MQNLAKRSSVIFVAIFGVSFFLLVGTQVSSAQTKVPKDLSAKLFSKVLQFDRTFQSADDPGILVAHSPDDEELAQFFVDHFGDQDYRSRAVSIENIRREVPLFQALLIVSPGTEASVYDEITANNGVLTICLDPDKVENGSASIGIKLVDKNPELLFNLNRLRREEHDIPSKVLKLGTVFGK